MPRQSAWVERSNWRELQFAAVAARGILTPGFKATAQGNHLLSHYLPFGQTACAERIMRASAAAVAGVAVLSRRKCTCGTFAAAGVWRHNFPHNSQPSPDFFIVFQVRQKALFDARKRRVAYSNFPCCPPYSKSEFAALFQDQPAQIFERHEVIAPVVDM